MPPTQPMGGIAWQKLNDAKSNPSGLEQAMFSEKANAHIGSGGNK